MYAMLRKLFRYFSVPRHLAALNAMLIATGVTMNIVFEVFCIPSGWAAAVLAVCFLNTIFYPLLERSRFAVPAAFVSGVAFFVFAYCIVFFGSVNAFGWILIVVGIGATIYLPHFFLVQIFWKSVVRPQRGSARFCFLTAVLMCVGVGLYAGRQYKSAMAAMARFRRSGYTQLNKSFMTEKILGMHFIYHTRYCDYDGWRPPMHEPLLIMGMWLNGMQDPLPVKLETRLALYKKFYPGRRYKFDCSCALMYSEDYHQDALWK